MRLQQTAALHRAGEGRGCGRMYHYLGDEALRKTAGDAVTVDEAFRKYRIWPCATNAHMIPAWDMPVRAQGNTTPDRLSR